MTLHITILIEGHLDRDWFAELNDLTIEHLPIGTTRLSGQVPDQAALYGSLNRLRDLGLKLISVTSSMDQEGI
jgi:hypothetical protein